MGSVQSRNNVTISGSGTRPMLFAHGFGCDQNMWRFVAPAFAADYKLVLFDYVGAGQSEKEHYHSDRYSTLHGYAQDLIDICDELELKDVILVGHSVSSMIGLMAAIDQPHLFSRIIMIGPSPCYINDIDYTGGFENADITGLLEAMDSNYIGWATSMAPAIMANGTKPEYGAELTQSFCSTDPVIAREFAEVTFLSDSRKDIEKLTTPTLILQCSDDIIAPDYVGKYLHNHMRNSVFVQMAATGHCPHVSAPEETISAIKNYLS